MLEQILKTLIPSQLSVFGKLTEGHDSYPLGCPHSRALFLRIYGYRLVVEMMK